MTPAETLTPANKFTPPRPAIRPHDRVPTRVDYRARYYSENDARFMSPDWSATVEPVPYAKLGDPQSLNLYSYVLNNPLTSADPNGHVIPGMAAACAQQGEAFCQQVARTDTKIGLTVAAGTALVAVGGEFAAFGRVAWTALAGFVLSNGPQINEAVTSTAEALTPGAAPGSMGSSVWSMAPAARGLAIESDLGANLPRNFPTIDKFSNGVATSIKSLDLNASSYQNAGSLASTIVRYIDKVASFNGASLSGVRITSSQISARALELAVPSAGSTMQQGVLNAAAKYASDAGVQLIIRQVH